MRAANAALSEHAARLVRPPRSSGRIHTVTGDGEDSDPAGERVFYSTPFGDTRDGQQRLFLLQRQGMIFMPAFRSRNSLQDFYEQANRAAYMILEGDLAALIKTNSSLEQTREVGIVIEPLSQSPIYVMPEQA